MPFEEFIALRFPEEVNALANPLVDGLIDFDIIYGRKAKDILERVRKSGHHSMRKLTVALIKAAITLPKEMILIDHSLYEWYIENGMPSSPAIHIVIEEGIPRAYVSSYQLDIVLHKLRG